MCFSQPLNTKRLLRHSLLTALLIAMLSNPAYAETTLSFISEKTTCATIFPLRKQWQKYPPTLTDPEKTPIFASDTDTSNTEWRRLYLPKHPLTKQEIAQLDPSTIKERTTTPHSNTPGLLVNSQPWIEFLQACPNRISSNRQLNPNKPADWVAPHFFELYEIPMKQGVQRFVVTQFTDHSPYFGGNYLALYTADNCQAEKLFVTQGPNQQLEFLRIRDHLAVSVKTPSRGSQSYFTVTENEDGVGGFVEVCRSVLDGPGGGF